MLHASAQGDALPALLPPDHVSGLVIGPYILLKRLGSGGMGAVYLVEYEVSGVRLRAALKILAPHIVRPSELERFQREQHILGSLDHPYITRMLDAGVDATGRPYLVMEYVEGVHLDVWCDDRKLGVEARLRTFLKVCAAVDAAHRNLIVHLDLKPSNILLTQDGTPKLLDFGTSKLLDPSGRFTTTTAAATPHYASPEQLRNEPVTTSCDIYSLGIILYELLAGRRPGRETSMTALVERAIGDSEPAPLDQAVTDEAAAKRGVTGGRLRTLLAGDLDTLVHKCLHVSPQDRYPSVNALATDIERYLSGRPVLARPQTSLYRMRKFARRNRVKVATSVLMLLALLASLTYAWSRQQQALHEGQRARRMQAFLYRLFKIANSNYTGKQVTTVQDFLRLGIIVLPQYVHDPGDLRQAKLSLAESMYWNRDYSSAQDVWGEVIVSARSAGDRAAESEALAYSGYVAFLQGKSDLALDLSRKGLPLARKAGVPPRTRAVSAAVYAIVRDELGRRTDENLRLFEYAVKEERDNRLPPHEIGQALYYLGAALASRGRLDEALSTYHEALEMYRKDPVALCDQANILYGIAMIHGYQQRDEPSISLHRQALDVSIRCHGADDPETLRLTAYWATALVRAGRVLEAVPVLEGNLPLCRKVFPPASLFLFEELYPLSFAYNEIGRHADAEPISREGLQLLKQHVPPNDKRLGRAYFMLGQSLVGQGRYLEAATPLSAAYPILSGGIQTPAAKAELLKLHAMLDKVRANVPDR